MVICDKHRKRANEIASMVVIGEVGDRDVVLIDDICDTGGTLAKAAGLLKEKGARSVRALCTHPVLSGNAYANIENSVLEELVVCDTIPMKQSCSKIKVLSVAELFAVAIRNAFETEALPGCSSTPSSEISKVTNKSNIKMQTITIEGQLRTGLGKQATRQLRSEGKVPGVIYGGASELNFSAPVTAFRPCIYTEFSTRGNQTERQDLPLYPERYPV